MATFTHIPSLNARVDYKPSTRKVSFGDGYEQRLSYGLNTTPEVWSLEFKGKTTVQATSIDAFLKSRNGVESFDWTSPTGTTGKFVCREWGRSIEEPNIESVFARFEQVFDL